jgi:hypothetical protein
MNHVRATAVLFGGLLVAATPLLGAPSAFGPSRPLVSVRASSVQADMNGRDATLVGWTHAGGVAAAFRPPAGPFGAPVAVGAGSLEAVAMAERGARGVVIRNVSGEIRATYVNRVRVLDDDLIRLRLLSGVTPRVIGARITPDGTGVLAVALEARNEWRLQTFRREGGRWERFGGDLVIPGQPQPRAAMDPAGDLSVAWVDDDDAVGPSVVQVSQRPADSERWSAPVVLTSVAFEAARPFTTAIAMNDRGDTAVGIVVLPVEPEGRARGFVALRPVGADTWALTADLPSVAGVAVTPAGDVWAAYRQAVVGASGDEVLLAAPLDGVNRRWGAPEPLDQYAPSARGTVQGPNLSALADGRLVALWSADSPTHAAFGAVRSPGGGWTAATAFGGTPALANGTDRGIVAWAGTGRVEAVRVAAIASVGVTGRQ